MKQGFGSSPTSYSIYAIRNLELRPLDDWKQKGSVNIFRGNEFLHGRKDQRQILSLLDELDQTMATLRSPAKGKRLVG